jgi:hypothetical protein
LLLCTRTTFWWKQASMLSIFSARLDNLTLFHTPRGWIILHWLRKVSHQYQLINCIQGNWRWALKRLLLKHLCVWKVEQIEWPAWHELFVYPLGNHDIVCTFFFEGFDNQHCLKYAQVWDFWSLGFSWFLHLKVSTRGRL